MSRHIEKLMEHGLDYQDALKVEEAICSSAMEGLREPESDDDYRRLVSNVLDVKRLSRKKR